MNELLSRPMLRRNATVEEAPLNEEMMLFNPATSQFYVLNRTMAFTWKKLETAASLDELTESLTTSFDGVNPDVAKNDLRKAVEQLISYGLVEPVE
jgi:coenzyme PQQ synthesis protein D (PqqD)